MVPWATWDNEIIVGVSHVPDAGSIARAVGLQFSEILMCNDSSIFNQGSFIY